MPRRSYLYFLAATRGVYASVEQPLASLLFSEPRIRAMIEMTRSDYLFFWMGGWGGLSMKPTAIWCTLPKCARESLYKSKQQATDRLGDGRQPLTIRTPRAAQSDKGWSSQGWTTGDKSVLSLSAEYPDAFCQAFASAAVSVLSAAARLATAVPDQEG